MKKLLILIFLLIPFISEAAPPARQVSYTSGTTIRASDVTSNEDEIFGYLNTGVDTIRTDGLDAITEVKASLRSGSDQSLITGTAGSNAEIGLWNSDGDLIGIPQMTGNTTGIGIPGLKVTNLLSCNTIDTDSTGLMFCGEDGGGSGSGAPTDAQYVVLALDGDLSAERTLNAGTNLTSVDSGANANITLNVDDAFIVNDANDTMSGILTADGLTLGANENITLGAQTLDHDGTNFAFSDTVTHTSPSADDSSTLSATTAYVQGEINGAGGTNLTCSSGSCNVDDAFIVNDASDTMAGTLTADGLTLGANENITLGSETLDHDGTNFNFSDSAFVNGSADAVQFTVQGHSTQTSDIFVVEDSGATDIMTGGTTGIKFSQPLAITNLVSCDTINTDSTGVMRCGTDATGAGSGAFSDASDPAILNTTTKDVLIGAAQKNSAKLDIDGDADQVQLSLQGHSTQTSNLFVIEENDGTDLMTGSTVGVKVSQNFDAASAVQLSALKSCTTLQTEGSGIVSCKNSGNLSGISDRLRFTLIDPNAAFDVDTQFAVWTNTDANITVTKLSVELDATGNEIAGDLKWADDFATLGNATVINDFDTTSGVRVDTSITAGAVEAGKLIYIQFDSQANAAITQAAFTVEYDYD